MKWGNLAERRPNHDDDNRPLGLLSKDMYFGTDDIIDYTLTDTKRGEEATISGYDGKDHIWPTTVLEWLDEPDYIIYADLPGGSETFKNTIEAVIEIIHEVFADDDLPLGLMERL